MYTLYIANKNYSSWSLRPWVLMRELGIGFEERLVPFGQAASWEAYRRVSPTGKVPCLIDREARSAAVIDSSTVVWDSLGITEYLAERHAGVWPQDPQARAWARCATAEMHSGFAVLRDRCSRTCGVRIRLHEQPPELLRDVARIDPLWSEGIARWGGPFLAGARFSAVDAFFAPVAFRVQTYGLQLGEVGAAYTARLLGLPAMQSWYAAAVAETWRDEPHEAEIAQYGTVVEDLRNGS
jgi:glutathione S-transferase